MRTIRGLLTGLGARTHFIAGLVTTLVLAGGKCGSEPCEGETCAAGGAAGDGGAAGEGGAAGTGAMGGDAPGGGDSGGNASGGSGGAPTTSSTGGGGASTTGGTAGAGGAAPTCDDGAQNGAETGADCGGPCPACPYGEGCGDFNDCEAPLVCSSGSCACKPIGLRISEIQAAGAQEPGFVEVYNGYSVMISQEVLLRVNDVQKFSGTLTLAPGERKALVFGSPVTGRAVLSEPGGAPLIDVVCWCQGNDCNLAPHPDCNGSQAANPAGSSIERRPLGVNCIDSGDHAKDFAEQSVPNPNAP